ncbi:hypothetical protein [Ureaplasma canigenitalium]|uniref:hypothetical protein n=1 Tax=Ureaplasma canigenitalium TaxID=42092 RepID=UPI0004E256F0|nr:hypothetical protein [Ureaplasma canigenitalium]
MEKDNTNLVEKNSAGKMADNAVKKGFNLSFRMKKIVNLVIIALVFVCFACSLIGSFDVKSSKYIIGIGTSLSMLIALALMIYRIFIITFNKDWTRKELIWQALMFALFGFIILGWIWSTILSTTQYDLFLNEYEQIKARNPNEQYILLVNGSDQFNVLKAGDWILVIATGAAVFSQTFYNTFGMKQPTLQDNKQNLNK